jgi:hypothetical protein
MLFSRLLVHASIHSSKSPLCTPTALSMYLYSSGGTACRTIEELKSKVTTLQEGLTLLLSAQALPAEAAAALTATLCKGGVLSSEQLAAAAAAAGAQAGSGTAAAAGDEEGRGDELEEVISAINRVSNSCLAQYLLQRLCVCCCGCMSARPASQQGADGVGAVAAAAM